MFLQFNLLPDLGFYWLNLALGWLLVLILVDFPLKPLLCFAFLAGLFLDVYGSVFFGFNLILWPLIVLLLYWVAKEILSLERNFFSSCVFLSLGFFVYYLLLGVGLKATSGNIYLWPQALPTFYRGLSYLLFNVIAALFWFFIFNYFRIKDKLNVERL